MDRRWFLKNSAVFLAGVNLASNHVFAAEKIKNNNMNEIKIVGHDSNFEREELRFPFGFKGGYLTELWQVVSLIRSEKGNLGIGLSTQSVLYGDSNFFARHAEAQGNALMYALSGRALDLIAGKSFTDPIELVDSIIPSLYQQAKKLTSSEDLNINFVYNALVNVDNALWMLYAKENGISRFGELMPAVYREAFSFKNDRIAIMFQISYDMPLQDIAQAAQQGYFIFKIKTGSPGSAEQMLAKDIQRLKQIHELLSAIKSPHTPSGKVLYTMDANGRYENKESLRPYLESAKQIGAFDHILLYEEPFNESNTEDVSDLGVLVACDESLHNEQDAQRKIALGYKAFVLKGIAKTLSQTLKIAAVAHKNGIPCLCSDLTVNPILIDWNKNIAASMKPFPGLGMGMMETNGDMNYKNWEQMERKHPFAGASWTQVNQGMFNLDDDFYKHAGGIFEVGEHYKQMMRAEV